MWAMWASYLLKLLIIFLGYYITAQLGLRFDAVGGFATLVWFPSGIALAALLLGGLNLWPGIFLGAFAANLASGAPMPAAAGIGAGNTLEAVSGAVFLKQLRFNHALDSLKDAILLILAAFFCTMLSATVGTTSLYLAGRIPSMILSPTWYSWWIGDMMSVLIVTPFLLTWSARQKTKPGGTVAEGIFLSALLLFLVALFFTRAFGQNTAPISYALFPPLVWFSLRFGQRGSTLAVFLISTIATYGTIDGVGPFIVGRLSQSLLYLQGFMGTVSVTCIVLSAIQLEKKRLEQNKDEFMSIVSHELKTPITSIKAYIQILERNGSLQNKKEAHGYLNRMKDQVDKLINLVNDLLDLSRIQVSTLEFNKESFSLNSVADDVIETARAIYPSHKFALKGSVKDSVYGDRERICQVIMNLLSNAVKYSKTGSKIVLQLNSDRENITVGVIDQGIGISKEHQSKIFDRFYRIHNGSTRSPSGFGIGLYLSSEIVKRHNGKIWVESRLNKGSAFYFSLPIAQNSTVTSY